MPDIEAVVITGVCVPERHAYARAHAQALRAQLYSFPEVDHSPLNLGRACEAAIHTSQLCGATAVLELPTLASLPRALRSLALPRSSVHVRDVICVVDAAHILDDLAADDFVPMQQHQGEEPLDVVARAALTIEQIEHASVIDCLNWDGRMNAELSLLTDLLAQLAPSAVVRLHSAQELPSEAPAHGACWGEAPWDGHLSESAGAHGGYEPSFYQAGWASVLNDEQHPAPADSRVSALRYQNIRPFHPERLQRALDEHIEPGRHGQVIRSVGFCRLATRTRITMQWDHVGHTISFHVAQVDEELGWGDELLSIGQDLAFIGIDLDHAALRASLDEAVLTNAELAAGPAAWQRFEDPFPQFDPAAERGE